MAQQQRVFTVGVRVDNARDFEVFAAMAARLKKHGQVEVTLGSVSGRADYDIPAGGSSWHDYTSYLSTLLKFFPHPKIAPFVDAGHVRKNQALLRACVRVLRKYKLNATFESHEPFYIAEGFFARHPYLRGARVDHPRRSRQEAFAMCLDHPEGQDILASMMSSLVREAPELSSFTIFSNDAGAGMCWNDVLYTAPNGPAHCRSRNTGERIASVVDALSRGAGKALDFRFYANLSEAEYSLIPHYVDERFYLFGRRAEPRWLTTGMFTDNPVQGIFDPVEIIETLAKTQDPKVRRISLGFANNYSRSHNDPAAAARVIELVSAFFDRPVCKTLDRMLFLRDQCARWAGEERADALFEALMAAHQALVTKQTVGEFIFRLTANYMGVSMRLINRPLVAMPERLTPDEEAYFLPYVFNVSRNEARTDYLDLHGVKLWPPLSPVSPVVKMPQIGRVCSMLHDAAAKLEGLGGGKALEVFRRMGVSLRIYAAILRSIHNFACMQVLRDRNRDKLLAPETLVPPKLASPKGDPDLIQIHELMRDELDNTSDLIAILKNGGLRQMALARRKDQEDTFLLGPGFLDTLERKRQIMRRHWRDASERMATPLI